MEWAEIKQEAVSVLDRDKLSDDYRKRLKDEFVEIEKQGANSFWVDSFNKKEKWESNKNGLVLPFLLNMTKVDPIKSKIKHIWEYQPDFPDIDLDFLPSARPTIKEYATKKYVHVCNVGNWIAYKPKSAIQDVARALGSDFREVIKITRDLPDEFDELTLEDHDKFFVQVEDEDPKIRQEAHKEISRYQTFYDYKTVNPDIVEIAFRMVGKIRSQGTHAGGLIISDQPIDRIVPLSYMKDKNGKYNWTSQWTEGRNTQLSKFGLIKFDVLGLKTIYYIWQASNLIKKNHGVVIDWDNMDPKANPPRAGYEISEDGKKKEILLNDPKSFDMCNDLRTESVFQIETNIQKGIISRGGVKTFDDLVVYNALGRPGPIEMIPEYINRRDDKNERWRDGVDERIMRILESTYGIICFHEDTLLSLKNGSHKPIKDIKVGDMVTTYNIDERKSENAKVVASGPTSVGSGIRIILKNGFCLVVTPNHEVLTYEGYKKAENLDESDLVAICNNSHDYPSKTKEIATWLGSDEDVAYLFGQLCGDGCLASTAIVICVGDKEEICDKLLKWISNKLNVQSTKYFHCRSWYIAISNNEKISREIDLPKFQDTNEWWELAYAKYSGSDIAKFLGRSTWFVYKRLHQYMIVKHDIKNPSKTKLHDLLEQNCLMVNLYNKRIPKWVMTSNQRIKSSFLAGLIDSDGCLSVTKRGDQVCYISSVSDLLLEDIRRLCQGLNIVNKIYWKNHRIYLYDHHKLYSLISNYLVIKNMDGRFLTGNSIGCIPRYELENSRNGMTNNEMVKKYRISKRTLYYKSSFLKSSTARKIGVSLNDQLYFPIDRLERVEDVQFHNVTVPPHHNVIANGIIAKQCYQEQLTSIWIELAKFTVPEADAARKIISKKWQDKLPGVEKQWKDGATKVIGEKETNEWWDKMVSFGRYAFNFAHSIAYSLITYRCLYIKAHYPAEWWAAVMTECHSKKLTGYMGAAKLEGVKFGPVNINSLTHEFSVIDGKVISGLQSIKGIGEKASLKFTSISGPFTDIDDAVEKLGKSKGVYQRLIQLGAFDDIHRNRHGLWEWYRYKYCSGKDITALRIEIKNKFMPSDEDIQKEINRRSENHKRLYPRRKVPNKILNYKPKVNPSREEVMALYDDYTDKEKLFIEKEYLGYYWSSPLCLYDTDGLTIEGAKTCGELEVVIEKLERMQSKSGLRYYLLHVTDGIQSVPITIWADTYDSTDRRCFRSGVGIKMHVSYNEERNNFRIANKTQIIPLEFVDKSVVVLLAPKVISEGDYPLW